MAPRAGSPDWLVEEVATLRSGLLTLRQNVLLLRDPERPDLLHPRFALTGTTSFKELPEPGWRAALAEMHDDYFYRWVQRRLCCAWLCAWYTRSVHSLIAHAALEVAHGAIAADRLLTTDQLHINQLCCLLR